MNPRSPAVMAAVAGLAFFVLSVLGIATLGQSPSGHATPSDVVHYFQAHRAAILHTMMILSLANGAMLVFFAQLRTVLQTRASRTSLPTLALVASALLCALGAATTALPAAVAYYGPQGVEPATVALARQIYFAGNAFSAMPAALAVASIGIAIAITRALPRWLAVASIALAVLELVSTFTLTGLGGGPDGGFAVGGLFGSLTAWVMAVSVTLLVQAARSRVRVGD